MVKWLSAMHSMFNTHHHNCQSLCHQCVLLQCQHWAPDQLLEGNLIQRWLCARPRAEQFVDLSCLLLSATPRRRSHCTLFIKKRRHLTPELTLHTWRYMKALIFFDSAFEKHALKGLRKPEPSKIHEEDSLNFWGRLGSWQRRIKLLFKVILGSRHYCSNNCFIMMCHFHILADYQRKPSNFRGESHSLNGKGQKLQFSYTVYKNKINKNSFLYRRTSLLPVYGLQRFIRKF